MEHYQEIPSRYADPDEEEPWLEEGELASEPGFLYLDRLRNIKRDKKDILIETRNGRISGEARITRRALGKEHKYGPDRGLETLEYVGKGRDGRLRVFGKKETMYDQDSGQFLTFRRLNGKGELLHVAERQGDSEGIEVKQYEPDKSGDKPVIERRYWEGELTEMRKNEFIFIAPDTSSDDPGAWKEVPYETEGSKTVLGNTREVQWVGGEVKRKLYREYQYEDGKISEIHTYEEEFGRSTGKPEKTIQTKRHISGDDKNWVVHDRIRTIRTEYGKERKKFEEITKYFENRKLVRVETPKETRVFTYNEAGKRATEKIIEKDRSGEKKRTKMRHFSYDRKGRLVKTVESFDGYEGVDEEILYSYEYEQPRGWFSEPVVKAPVRIVVEDRVNAKLHTLDRHNYTEHEDLRALGKEELPLPEEYDYEDYAIVDTRDIEVVPD